MSCKYVGAERPRIIIGRHEEGCAGNCAGCQPCPWPHCRRCGKEHSEHTCPGCLADVRSDLEAIASMCAALPTEATHRGVDSEAMNLLGPVADPESLGHMRASVNVGRIPADWLEAADDERHPLLVLGTWQQAYAEAFEHVDPSRITVSGAASYLDRNLTYAGAEEDVEFNQFAREVSACRTYMERVLHDGEQIETGAPCMTCSKPLLRVYSGAELPWTHRDHSHPLAPDDGWACRSCREWRSEQDYRLNVADLHRDNAEWLTDQEMQVRTGIRAGTVREWARSRDDRDALVSKRRDSGRVVYLVADVERVAGEKGMMSA